MKLNTLITVNAVVQFVLGLGFLLTPVFFLGVFGASTDAVGETMTRVTGSLVISLGIISALGRGVTAADAKKAIMWGSLTAHLLAGAFTLLSILNGSFNSIAWAAVVMDAFFVVAFYLYRKN